MAITFLALFFLGLLSRGCLGDDDDAVPEEPSRPISLSDLPGLLDDEEDIQHLYDEFASIAGGQRQPWTIASLPENIQKNRYDDLLAFDHSRVVLEKIPGDAFSDYINANYIDGANSIREYVATQGPLPNTISDFWRMIWQLNATRIVMLANLIEHGKTKVEKYWPDRKGHYGDIEVTKLFEFNISHLQHAVRTFLVKKSGIPQARIVRHFHFTGWPDLGVPQNRLQVLAIMRQARRYHPTSNTPIVVHCSAGIGRTGTIILMDSMIQTALKEHEVDFPKRLNHMRLIRPDVVEKKEQYVFAHKALNDLFNEPETEKFLQGVDEEYRVFDKRSDDLIPPKDLHDGLNKMRWQNTIMSMLIDSMTERAEMEKHIAPSEVNEITDEVTGG